MELTKFTVPNQSATGHATIETRPTELQSRLNKLTYHNYPKTTTKLLAWVSELNRIKIPASKRLELLLLYNQPCHSLFGFQLATHRKKPHRQSETFTQDVCSLAREMATGYKITINELSKNSSPLVLAYQMAFSYLNIELLSNYLDYLPCNSRIWKELNTLYRNSEALQITDKPADTHSNVSEEYHLGCADSFKISQLIYLLDPHGIPSHEILLTYQFLTPYIKLTEILEYPTGADQDTGVFLINLASNKPAQTIEDHEPGDTRQLRVLSNTRLMDLIKLRLRDIDDTTAGSRTPLDQKHYTNPTDIRRFLERLLNCLSRRASRSSKRKSSFEKLSIVPGLSSVYGHLAYLNNDDATPNFSQETSIDSATTSCKCVDSSPGGFCFKVRNDDNVNLNIGQLVHLKSSNDTTSSKETKTGVIRWKRQIPHQGHVYGTQYLSNVAEPVEIRLIDQKFDPISDFQATLMLNIQGEKADNLILLSPHGMYQTKNRLIEVKLPTRTIVVEAAMLIESTREHDRFYAKRAPADKSPPTLNKHEIEAPLINDSGVWRNAL